MLKNYFKTALRSLSKKKTYSFLNIAGLAIGITCASLIFLWTEDEWTFNHNFSKRDLLYRIYENQTYEGKVSTFHATPGPLAQGIQAEIPGIKNVARSGGTGNQLFRLGDKSINEPGDNVDTALLSMLALPFVHGTAVGAFRQLHSLVINESMAKKFFGDADPVGRSLNMNNQQDYVITGVFQDLPKNSTFQFHWLAPMENIENKMPWMHGWSANWARTYVELDPSANPSLVNKQLAHYLKTKQKGNTTECFLFAMNDWNLFDSFIDGKQDGGRIAYVRLFFVIAWIILLIACINFMNLATARSEQRAKEVGMRKVMGAGKSRLIGQFIVEALLMAFIAVILSVLLMTMTLPAFNLLVEKELSMAVLAPAHIFYLVSIGIITGLIAGSYPAFYLSSFNPIGILKGIRIKASTGSSFIRQGLVVIQFSVSIVLIIGTVIIYQQLRHVRSRELGYNKNDLVYIERQGRLDEHFDKVNQDLKQTGVVEDAALSDYPITQIWNNADNYFWNGKDVRKNPLITWEDVNSSFVSTMNIKLVAGRNFYSDPTLDSNSVLINESLARQMGKEGRVGGIIQEGKKPFQVVGIMGDFLYNTLYEASAPLLLHNHPTGAMYVSIRVKQDANLQDALSKVEAVLKADNPGYPVDFKFIDEDFNLLFKTETLTGKLAGLFAALAIFISCLGLFGLAAYTAERRIKEIGIRKVLGASVSGLAGLLSRDFIRLVAVSCIISFPLAWWALHNWLQGYAYRVDIHWWVFAIAGTLAILIAMATVSFQAIKAAIANPIKNLRTE